VIATPQQLAELAEELGVTDLPKFPPDDQPPVGLERLLARAQNDVEVLGCHARFSDVMLEALEDDQAQALAGAVCAQALWLNELDDEWLGPTDIAALAGGEVSFSRDPRPRLSPAVLETLALRGLIHRSGTVLPDPEPAPPPLPWWLWL
jgi:hypothetical protein